MTGIFLYGQALSPRVGHAPLCRPPGTETLNAGVQAALLTRLRANSLSVLSEKPG